jgi:hypothetical protein
METVKHEDRQNEELLALSRRILELTEANSASLRGSRKTSDTEAAEGRWRV